ncbi:MAG: hypothetical protein KJ077_37995 [Anaerolineae bacterium]|nr:hypothetical protein [Anaerolineae bacterium]
MNNQPAKIENKLFNKIPSDLSESEIKILFEQYKLFVEMQDKVSERRHSANTFFLTVNTALVTAIVGFISITPQPNVQYGWIILAAIAGVVFSFTWWRLIQSYKQLNSGKFKIIHLLETRLPAKLFDAEWDALGHGDGTVYRPFNQEEKRVPIVFGALYGLVCLFAVWNIIVGFG